MSQSNCDFELAHERESSFLQKFRKHFLFTIRDTPSKLIQEKLRVIGIAFSSFLLMKKKAKSNN